MNNNAIVQLNYASKRRRCLASLTDILLSTSLFAILMATLIYFIVSKGIVLLALLMFPVICVFYGSILLRDVIFGGASIGKRLLGLQVVDAANGEIASTKARAIRGISVFILFIDFLFLIFTKKSLGDRIGNTAVVLADTPRLVTAESIEGEALVMSELEGSHIPVVPVKKRGIGKALLVIVLSLALTITVFSFVLGATMSALKEKEEYKVAVEYILESEYFESLGVSEDAIELVGVEYTISDGISYAILTFNIEADRFTDTLTIVCVDENGKWVVSPENSGINRNQDV